MNYHRTTLAILLLIASLMLVTHPAIMTLPSSPNSLQLYRTLVKMHNLQQIDQANSQGQTYRLAPNDFIDLTLSEFAEMFGSSPQLPSEEKPMIGATVSLAPKSSIDWRKSGKVSRVKNQRKTCNACYAFIAVADIETSLLLAGQSVSLSQQQIVDCSSSFGNNGCWNGFYSYAFDYAKKNPLTTDSLYPYVAKVQACRKTNGQFRIRSYLAYNGNNCNFLQNMLMLRPVIVSVDGTNFYWQFYQGGVLSRCGRNNKINHGVQIVGVEYMSNGSSWWVAKNSWGSSWGESGFIRLDRTVQGGNICLVCSYIYHSLL